MCEREVERKRKKERERVVGVCTAPRKEEKDTKCKIKSPD